MTLEKLQNDMNQALKDGNKFRRMVIADLIASIQKASMSGKTRVEVTEKLIDEVLLKAQKTVQEMIDTCPAHRTDKFVEYKAQMQIINEYAPKLITDPDEIRNMIQHILSVNGTNALVIQKGVIMKMVMPQLRGKVDMAVANKVLGEMLK